MISRPTPKLVRDDPARDPLIGNIKVTREDWLNIARDTLVHEGVGQVKILSLADKLGVSRSSFYWYFKSRNALLEALLIEWEHRNTHSIIAKCQVQAGSITAAVCNFFHCFVDKELFDHGLDFAVREWARRDVDVRTRIDLADQARLDAVVAMFQRHGFADYDAECRARILYFMQIGYHALDVRESIDLRLSRIKGYLRGFTGQEGEADLLADFESYARRKAAPR